ncbi:MULTISPECIES: LysR family transcriptional regulator [unclassified Acidovorax]|uniref:LysR family transcriptional regulator n=1 Tax=unclassified Acidovorax TaxID=2684926 RepID=UPI001C43F109|nr:MULTISPECIES: LysR family transcriptional regulator [unclassified Acidovorax]MBV7462964.1 LysR family transcriptional regulator [Acidovorax sp. sif0632]MBV7467990.1 LysR family transcriptional regulator [Acidovorax sp. sif0613]
MDKLRNMEVMVAVVEAGSFAAAARQLQISAVMVGKHIQQLEAHLGARLFQRSTRQNSLTEVGAAFYEDSKRVLEQVRWAESAVERSRAVPQGLLRVSAPFTLGNHVIAPLVADFLKRHEQVRVDLQLTDSVVDLAGEGFDLAVRIGQVVNEGLVARPLRPYRMVIAAAPSYLQRHGTPECAADLARHQCLSHSVWQRRVEWTLRDGDTEFFWPENARLTCNQGDGLRQAALRGLGLIMQPEVLLADDLASGALVPVMQPCLPAPRPVQLVYAPDRRQLPKLARFVEYVVGTLGVDGH